MNYDLTEFFKLVGMCAVNDIPFTVNRIFDGWQVKTDFDDAVIHFGSHGHEKGLLESYIANDCAGWETAEEIFEIWKEMA